LFFHDTTLLSRRTGSNDNYHHIAATPISGKVRHFRVRLRTRVCDVDLYPLRRRLSFLSCMRSITRRNSRRNSGSSDPAIQKRTEEKETRRGCL
jgi:hypothetical protein